MDPLQGKRRAYVVVNILTEVQLGSVGCINLRKAGFDFEFQLVKATVAWDCDRAADTAFHIYRGTMADDCRRNHNIRRQNVRIAELFKELTVCLPEILSFNNLPRHYFFCGQADRAESCEFA